MNTETSNPSAPAPDERTELQLLRDDVARLTALTATLVDHMEQIKENDRRRMLCTLDVMDMEDAAAYLKKSPGRLRQDVHQNRVPYYKDVQRVYFRREELDSARLRERHASVDEYMERADRLRHESAARRKRS